MDRQPFLELARKRVVVLDGSMGATLHSFPLDLQRDWRGQENCCEILNLSRPDLIEQIHEGFLAVGCDGIETNSFSGSRIVLAEAGLAERTVEVNRISAQIARKVCDRFETPDRPRYVIGSVGPGTKIVTLGQTTWDEMNQSFFEQIQGLLEGGADVLLIETQQDLLAIKCAIAAANRAFAVVGRRVPIMAQASMDTQNGRQMLTGSDASALVAAIQPFDELRVWPVRAHGDDSIYMPELAATGQHSPQRGSPDLCEQQGALPNGAGGFHQGRYALRGGIRGQHRRRVLRNDR
jgi:5-methyltetrahydrofolate--homocysteine methyltransferase